nr:hypothetical protein [Kofleriaceae bacterium]
MRKRLDVIRRRVLPLLDRRWMAVVIVTVLAAAVLLPGLGDVGFWDPQERQLADKAAPRPEIAAKRAEDEAKAEAAAADAKQKAAERAAKKAEKDAQKSAGSAAAVVPAPKPELKAEAPEPAVPTQQPAEPAQRSAPVAGGVPSAGGVPGGAPPKQAAPPPPPPSDCSKAAPKDATARNLTADAAAWGRDNLDDSDAGRRLPLAIFGLLTVLALAGTTLRLATPRAAIIAAAVALSFPLLVLQSRQLTSEIGTACGGALIVYALVALADLCPRRGVVVTIADAALSLVVLAAGLVIGFCGGGALLGLAVPFGACALAGALGASAFAFLYRAGRYTAIAAASAVAPRLAIDRRRPLDTTDAWRGAIALVAAIAAVVALALIAYDIYELKDPVLGAVPAQREVFGKVVTATQCYSSSLGGSWRADEDLRMIFDSSWEQIAYGTYPWGILAPIAIGWLVASGEPRRRRLGAVALAWAALSWLATEVFLRKVGFALWAGFPAFAIALGAWLDGILTDARTRGATPTASAGGADRAIPPGAILIGLFAILAVFDVGKDLQESPFTDKLSSLLVGGDGVTYPAQAHIFGLPAKLAVLCAGMVVALGFGLALILWRDRRGAFQKVARVAAAVALAGTALLGAFWSFAWYPSLGEHLSSKALFDTFHELAAANDRLVVMGDLGDAAHDYAPEVTLETVSSRAQVVAALGSTTGRVFAIAPQGELCQLHREIGGKPYFVVDDRNVRSLLLSNRVDGTTDKNPLATEIVHSEPTDIPNRPKKRVVWDNKVELLGWDIPATASRSDKLTVRLFYKILAPVGGAWKIILHFDNNAPSRFNGDHEPINNRCPTSTWQKDDYIIDTYTLIAGNTASPKGTYEIWTGFFTGQAPNFKNMAITEAPPDMRDGTDRAKITTIDLE